MTKAKKGNAPGTLDAVHISTLKDDIGFRLHLPRNVPRANLVRALEREALRWTYLLRSRTRWIGDLRSRELNEQNAREVLSQILGNSQPDAQPAAEASFEDESTNSRLKVLADSEILVVRVPYVAHDEGKHWESRIFPWEYLLSAATRSLRLYKAATDRRPRTEGERLKPGQPSRLTVMRELVLTPPLSPVARAPSKEEVLKILFVECLPAELRGAWSLNDELAKLSASLPHDTQWTLLRHPSLRELQQTLAARKPHLVHFAGIDSHQGIRELQSLIGDGALVDIGPDANVMDPVERPPKPGHPTLRLAGHVVANLRLMVDGVLLRSEQGCPLLVRAHELASVLRDSGHVAYLVTFNLSNTAARVAPMLVAHRGAMAAVGFQDVFDDSLAEFFHVMLFRHLLEKGWYLPEAFHESWSKVRQLDESVTATGIVLWSGVPLLPRIVSPPPYRTAERLNQRLHWDIKPHAELSYAVLHNAQPLFEKFVLETDLPSPDLVIDVDVTVHLGVESARFSRRIQMTSGRVALTGEIHVPLTAEVARTVHESINSSIAIEIRANDDLVYRNSHRVRLLPVDQWRDNRRDGRWLPSFVQPRDPAVMRAVQQAQRYVRVLRDDPVAGFDGYPGDDETDEESLLGVDRQVEAIWATLLHDWQLGYINPPPTYSGTLDSQRLRVPSSVLANRAGTCIDLALLFAACLELIDIYPVIFLLEGHALPGWWRHSSFRDEYKDMWERSYVEVVHASATENGLANAQLVAWHTGKASYGEVRRWISERKLVPIETVRLTENYGFAEAIDGGVAALSDARDFDSMLDIVTARYHLVTPLPLIK